MGVGSWGGGHSPVSARDLIIKLDLTNLFLPDRITFRMAPPLFHSFLQKGLYQSGKLDTILFYFE